MHMAFLSRVFKNLQWYGMTMQKRRTKLSVAFRIFLSVQENIKRESDGHEACSYDWYRRHHRV